MVTKKPCTDFSNSCSYHLKLDPANSTYRSVFSTMNAVFSALNPTMVSFMRICFFVAKNHAPLSL